jgi:hypothetical protein
VRVSTRPVTGSGDATASCARFKAEPTPAIIFEALAIVVDPPREPTSVIVIAALRRAPGNASHPHRQL